MSSQTNPLDGLDFIWTDGDDYIDNAGYAGKEVEFDDTDPTDTRKKRRGTPVRARLVKNASGGVLAKNEAVKPVLTSASTAVEEVDKAGAGDLACGVVNDHIGSAGVAANAWFYAVFRGNNEVRSSAAITAGVVCKTAADGEAVTTAGTAAETAYCQALVAATGANEDILARILL